MAISASKRKALPRGAYVYGPKSSVGGKGRKAYPIDTKPRARNALARAAQSKTGGTYARVEKAVNRKWPSIATRHHTPRTSSRGRGR
jgi:hypothetical protein